MDSDAAQLRPVRQIFSKNGNASRFARGRQQQAIPIRRASGRSIGECGPHCAGGCCRTREEIEPVDCLRRGVSRWNDPFSADGRIEFGNRLQCQPTIESNSVLDNLA